VFEANLSSKDYCKIKMRNHKDQLDQGVGTNSNLERKVNGNLIDE